MTVLELFAGTRSIGKAFEEKGHKVISIDWDKRFEDIDLYADIGELTVEQIIELCGSRTPDVIWASPDCTTYSKMTANNHHVRICYTPIPVSEYAKYCDENNSKLFNMINKLSLEYDIIYFIENPQGYLRYMNFVSGFPRYTITYCQYGLSIRKATDIFTNFPNPRFKPPCGYKSKCHIYDGVRKIDSSFEKSKIPIGLCEHIVKICDEYFDGELNVKR